MSGTLDLNARTATSITLAVSALSGGVTSTEIQYGTTKDFQFCIAPIIVGPAAPGNFVVQQLNRAQLYWFRIRSLVGGVRQAWGTPIALSTVQGADSAAPTGVAIQPVLIIPQEPVVAWSIGASGAAVAGYPTANLGVLSPQAAARFTMSGGNQLIFRAQLSGKPIDTVALLDTNLPEAATWRVGLGDTLAAADAGTGYQSADVAFRASANLRGRRGYHGYMALPAAQEFRFVSIRITGVLPGALLHMTHAVFGQARVARNWSDYNEQPFDLGTLERLRDGSPDAVNGFRSKKLDFSVSAMTETQNETQFADLGQRVGFTDHALIVPNSKANIYFHDRLAFGTLTQHRMTGSNQRFDRTFTIESIIN